MNRQIKFRGKRIDNGEWVYGYLLHGDVIRGKGIAIHMVNRSWCEVSCHAYVVIPETVGQLVCMIPNTSMYVDNSRELYEGDLIRQKGDKTIYKVVFDHNRFYGISNEGDEWGAFICSLHDKSHLEKIEIAGNIHDNSDLLTTK